MNRESLDEVLAAVKVFPLPGTLLFPGLRLPLRVFEPRYLFLMADVIEGDKYLTVPQIVVEQEADHLGKPAVYPYTTLGRIAWQECVPPGVFNIVIEPLRRIRLVDEVPTGQPYRAFSAELLEDVAGPPGQLERLGLRLLGLLPPLTERLPERGKKLWEGLSQLGHQQVPEVLAPLVLDAPARQAYLAENHALRRAEKVELALLTLRAEGRESGGEA